MGASKIISGVYVAALTPLKADFSVDLAAIPALMRFYAERGCHGALLLGTTGEGPSFAPGERVEILQTATKIWEDYPAFQLLAGTGTPSLEETIQLNKAAFDLGYQSVVVLPPYYFRKASIEGLTAWFRNVIKKSVPEGSSLLGYHIPGVSGVPISFEFLQRIKNEFPDRFSGIKDSSGNKEFAQQVGNYFKNDLVVLTGNDRLLSFAMENHAAGCITAMANMYSPHLRMVWDAHQRGLSAEKIQNQLNAWRAVLEKFSPYAPTLKALLSHRHDFPLWPVRPPLEALTPEQTAAALYQFEAATSS